MILTIAFGLQIAALAIQIVYLLLSASRDDRVSVWVLAASGCALLSGFIRRSMLIGFFALTNTYESLLFFSLCITVLLTVFKLLKQADMPKILMFGGTFISIVFLAIASSPIAPDAIRPPVPALQSHWLVLHVAFAFIGEAFFVVSFVASIAFLLSKSPERKRLFDKLTYTSIAIGYPIFTAGALIFGAVWASYAWGSFWSWDPKETWALITWLTYTAYLHARFVKIGRRKSSGQVPGSLPAWISITGFLFTMFTFFGVNYLLTSLHSYT